MEKHLGLMFNPQNKVEGTVKFGFESVREIFENSFRVGDELSAQLCVFHMGQKVIDLWGSNTDSSYNGDTLQTVCSCSKNVTSLCLAMLVDRGLLQYSDKVSDHWPEFGQYGKEEITVADVMRHEAGMPFFNAPVNIKDSFRENLQNQEVGKVIENQEPFYVDNSNRREYHALTRGLIIQELFRRIDVNGRSIGTFLKEEITDLIFADTFMGLDLEDQKSKNIANVITMTDKEILEAAKNNERDDIVDMLNRYQAAQEIPEDTGKEQKEKSYANEEFSGPLEPLEFWNSPDLRRAEIPSAGVLSSARGLGAISNILANFGSSNGKTYLSKEGWDKIHANPTEGEMFGMKTFFTQGGVNYYKDGKKNSSDEVTSDSEGNIHYGQLVPQGMYGWAGYGGSLFLWDPDSQVGFVYIPTYLAWYDNSYVRGIKLLSEVYKCLEGAKR